MIGRAARALWRAHSLAVVALAAGGGIACGGTPRTARQAPPPASTLSPSAARAPDDAAPVAAKSPAPDDAPATEAMCPAWRLPSHAAFARLRASVGGRRLSEMSTCCNVTATATLCREEVSANHVVGAMSGTRLVGFSETSESPWLEVPIKVGEYASMRFPPRTLMMLDLATVGSEVTLTRAAGECPRPCARPGRTCRGAEREAQAACDGLGTYEAGRAGKRPAP